ncbi:MAG TPA: shikimate kinase [Chitinophagaceae bacterium]|nr:shikimate kinase [Chitinophagaceae bacterium]
MRIYLIGFMGSGKTHWGRLLSSKLTLPFFDLDKQIMEEEKKTIVEIFEQKGEEYFRMIEKEVLYILTESHESFVMACGGGTPCYFNNIDYMNNNGTSVWLNTRLDVLFTRLIKEKEVRPLLKNLSDGQLKQFILKKFSERRIYYEQANLVVEESEASVDSLIQHIMHV